ncbi:DUF4388 domain-containing protein [Cronbergia sp. UHCC 0137]|uniref:DUF4388 domain-containing protein n=1 Tax=Cronbergia sp. UHCC 0137 TaxID=3110239 RepID=UPI002B2059CD|nr:DUF4388 domain-containing protein [Cronbergia sp. UHCC 0137]MEA5616310.1 DUF4388 domain-containing protein [Cronbergia sp. UHCC 0137]
MTISGNFADFSLPELLRFLDQGKKTGLLEIELSPEAKQNQTKQIYIWLHQGRVMTVADRLDQQGLTLMIAERKWISERVISRVTQISSCFINSPLGLCLKSQGLLQPEQLKLLYHAQVLLPIGALFQVSDASFKFEPTTNLPVGEMTGINMSATEVMLTALRSLQNWKALADALPDPTSGLCGVTTKQPQIQLNAQEWQVWEFVNGQVSLKQIAKQLRISVDTVQHIAFRLMIVGLVEEHFMVANAPTPTLEESMPKVTLTKSVHKSDTISVVSQSLLKNLMGFLWSKAKTA